MAVENKLSKLVKDQFPDFYKEEGANFLAFMEAYYAWMEENGNLTDGIQNLKSYRDIATTTDDYINYFFDELLPSVPIDVQADKRLMAKYVKQFNQSRGTLASYKLLFRSIYNEDIEVYYPADSILKVSDGDWRIDRYLVSSFDSATYAYIGKTIKGLTSGAEAFVESIVRRQIRGRDLMQILLSNVRGIFTDLEQVRLKSDEEATGHIITVEAGINTITLTSAGGEYERGDVIRILSDRVGDFGKAVVADVVDLGGSLAYDIVDGGSGYTTSIEEGGTTIEFIGGDATEPGSFDIAQSDIAETYAVSINTNLIGSNTVYGASAPTVNTTVGDTTTMSTFANVIIGAASYGFPELSEIVTAGINYRDHANAVLVVANTSNPNIAVGSSLYAVYAANGTPTGANAIVNMIKRSYNSTDVILDVDGYRNFRSGEKVNIATADGLTVGTVSSFSGNTIGRHYLEVATLAGKVLVEGDEVKGLISGATGVVKSVGAANNNAYDGGGGDVRDVYPYMIAANSSANVISSFDTGPLKGFRADEPVVVAVGGSGIGGVGTLLGNVIQNTTNTVYENVYTRLIDSLVFKATYFGTIVKLSNRVGGSGYTITPTISVVENDIGPLNIGESILTLRSANSQLLLIDTTDRVNQAAAIGDVKRVYSTNTVLTTTGTIEYEAVVKVWQRMLQRSNGINFANNVAGTVDHLPDEYEMGYEADLRTTSNTINVNVIAFEDRGILGQNADIRARVGANGTITTVRVVDSGFSYRQGERIVLEASPREGSTGATGIINLRGVANAEGYYSSSRSHISTVRGYIQDGRYYQEFSYEIVSPVSLNRYRDIALNLCHPAGQGLFGRFRSQSNSVLDISANTVKQVLTQSNGTVSIARTAANGTVSITDGTFNLTGSSTYLSTEFAANVDIVIEHGHNNFFEVRLNTANSATTANLKEAWAYGNVTGANVYFANNFLVTGSSTTLTSEFANGDTMYIETSAGQFSKVKLNKVSSATSANLISLWPQADISGATVYYVSNVITSNT